MSNIFLSVRGWVVCQADNIPGWKNIVVTTQVLVDFCLLLPDYTLVTSLYIFLVAEKVLICAHKT